jgi:DNA-binding response OmpR family regulator
MKLPQEGSERSRKRSILAVDDDPEVRKVTRAALENAGFEVWGAKSAEEALELLESRGLPHLAVIDIMLPGLDGLGLSRKIGEFSDLPIIMLTVIDETETVVKAIDQYAEDYITKPFSPSELAARVKRVLRRIGDFSYTLEPVVEIDSHLAIDFVRQRAVANDRPVTLTPTETKLLYILMNQAGKTVPTEQILARLWPGEEADENTLRVHVHRLRQKIERSPSRPHYVVTERGVGYSFLAP